MLIGSAILLFFLAGMFSIVLWSWWNGISPMPTSPKAKRCLLSVLPQKIEGNVVELGSGWGTLLFPLARKYPHCRVSGYETSPLPFFWTKSLFLLKPSPNLFLYRKDFFDISLEDNALIVCYLYPGAMRRLKDKFEKELKPGTWVISNTFAIPGWQPQQVAEINDLYFTKIYVYRKK